MTNQNVINQFIINTVLIDPISDILLKLDNGNFRDCDIKWLDNKFDSLLKFTCETLNVSVIMPNEIPHSGYKYLNEFVKTQYKERFNLLLNYFKTF